MSRADAGGDGPDRLTRDESATLDFEAARDGDSESWGRGDPRRALIEQEGRFGFRVCFPGGDVHVVVLAREDGVHRGWCDCKGFEYHKGPCRHLCTVKKAAFVELRDARGDVVTVASVDDLEDEQRLAQQAPDERDPEEIRADGGPDFRTDAEGRRSP